MTLKRMIKRSKVNRLTGLFLIAFMGMALTAFAAGKKLDPDSKEFYQYARHFFTKTERKIFLKLPNKAERERFIKYFWEIRDPNPYTEENEFQEEIMDRYEYVKRYLKEGPTPGWKTDRGRVYLILGPPWQKDRINYNKGSIIYWYFEAEEIRVRFVDADGNGFYTMDLNYISVKFLDVLKNRKHYISTKGGSKFSTGFLNFDMTYDAETRELVINCTTKDVNFEKTDTPKKMMAKFKIDLMIYSKKVEFKKLSEVKTVYAAEEDLLKEDSRISIRMPLPDDFPTGKIRVDTIVTDFLGDATNRKLLKVTIDKKTEK